MDHIDEQFYAIAAQEVSSRNVLQGLMAKALVDAEGDERKTIANYIRLRVAQLREAHELALAQQEEERQRAERERILARERAETERILARKWSAEEERILSEENERLRRFRPSS